MPLPNIDHVRYDYENDDGTNVTVDIDASSIDDITNGDRISVYHYDEDGEKLAYYGFRVQNMERRETVKPHNGDEKLPKAVVKALHSGGWSIANTSAATTLPTESLDPLPIQLLNARDVYTSWGEDKTNSVLGKMIPAIGRMHEQVLVTYGTGWMTEDFDSVKGRFEGEIEDDIRADDFELDKLVKTLLKNAAYPDIWDNGDKHREYIEQIEEVRRLYNGGMEYEEALDAVFESTEEDQ